MLLICVEQQEGPSSLVSWGMQPKDEEESQEAPISLTQCEISVYIECYSTGHPRLFRQIGAAKLLFIALSQEKTLKQSMALPSLQLATH